MDAFETPDLQQELDSLSASIQGLIRRLLVTTHNVQNDTIVKIAQTADVSRLKSLSTPGKGRAVDEAIEDAFEIFDYRARVNHSHFLAFVPGPAQPVSWLGDILSSAFNSFAGSKLQGSGVAVVEKELIRWMACKAGLPNTAGGAFVSGGSMANLSAMAMARDQNIPSGKEDLGVAYLSDQTHYSVAKALRILGFKTEQIRLIPSNERLEMDSQQLAAQIVSDKETGRIPFVVVGTCGTTNTGAIDPLSELAAVCKVENLWFHVDGAYGASVALSASRSHLVQNLGLADSISWDAHKWLFQTYACSALLVRDQATLLRSFGNSGDYLRDAFDDETIPNFWNYGIELTRPARAMKLWFTIRVLGVETLGRMIDQGFLQAEKAEEEFRKLDNWEITSSASMAILTFRYIPTGKTELELDEANRHISHRLMTENIATILTTKLRGKTVLRICSISPHLGVEGVAELVLQVDKVARTMMEVGGS
jgi:glutamate/tyrosine decarboxylase-like PLP-dependent enzyme